MRAALPLFDLYVMVDWSAAAMPKTGKDSIWIHALSRRTRGLEVERCENPDTRHRARDFLRDLLRTSIARKNAVLVGFDFAFGYPQGFAAGLGLTSAAPRSRSPSTPPWRDVWDEISDQIEDDARNGNNRFEVAASFNRRLTNDSYPFWGHPPKRAYEFLNARCHGKQGSAGFPERRIVELRTKGTKPVWKLAYQGCVGSQSLMGIPVLRALRNDRDLEDVARIWPFETGLGVLGPRAGPLVIFAEIYPSLYQVPQRRGEVRDRAQVRHLARHFARLDGKGELAPLFAGDPGLSAAERRTVENEEGWVLGVAGRPAPRRAPPRYRYLKDAAAIYRRSFALIRREVDLGALPADLRSLARRLVHASAEPTLIEALRWSPKAAARGRAALAAGAPLLVDGAMVAAGITRSRLPKRNHVLCLIEDRRVPDLARRLATTRSAAAVELWRPYLAGAVVAIGNAPTALFYLLEMLAAGAPAPTLVLGFPVGFVGAAEAKEALADNPFGLSYVTLAGRRGGSALAAAAVNALAEASP